MISLLTHVLSLFFSVFGFTTKLVSLLFLIFHTVCMTLLITQHTSSLSPPPKGPDCTLMSKVGDIQSTQWMNERTNERIMVNLPFLGQTFKVKSSSHSNAVEEAEMAAMNPDIDRGCFGTEITKPALGEHVKATQFSVQISTFLLSRAFPLMIRAATLTWHTHHT